MLNESLGNGKCPPLNSGVALIFREDVMDECGTMHGNHQQLLRVTKHSGTVAVYGRLKHDYNTLAMVMIIQGWQNDCNS